VVNSLRPTDTPTSRHANHSRNPHHADRGGRRALADPQPRTRPDPNRHDEHSADEPLTRGSSGSEGSDGSSGGRPRADGSVVAAQALPAAAWGGDPRSAALRLLLPLLQALLCTLALSLRRVARVLLVADDDADGGAVCELDGVEVAGVAKLLGAGAGVLEAALEARRETQRDAFRTLLDAEARALHSEQLRRSEQRKAQRRDALALLKQRKQELAAKQAQEAARARHILALSQRLHDAPLLRRVVSGAHADETVVRVRFAAHARAGWRIYWAPAAGNANEGTPSLANTAAGLPDSAGAVGNPGQAGLQSDPLTARPALVQPDRARPAKAPHRPDPGRPRIGGKDTGAHATEQTERAPSHLQPAERAVPAPLPRVDEATHRPRRPHCPRL
jgi:hypothetical protein